MTAQIIPFPGTAPAKPPQQIPHNQVMRLRHEVQDLLRQIGRGVRPENVLACTVQVRNFLLVRYSVYSIDEIPPESLEDAAEILREMNGAVEVFQKSVREIRDQMERECLGSAAPWTPWVKRKMRALKEDLPQRPDWVALAQRVGVELRRS